MTFPIRRSLAALLALSAAGLAGCAEDPPDDAAPSESLHFPVGAAMTPEGTSRTLLLVVNSNFDLRYRSGTLQAFDADRIDELIETTPAPGCPEEQPKCRPVEIPDLPQVGLAEIGDFGGEVAVATLPDGSLRAFVPVRATDEVVALDVDPASESALSCANGGGTDCRDRGVSFPASDPFGVSTFGNNVYFSHVGFEGGDENGFVAAAFADAGAWEGQGGGWNRNDADFATVSIGDTASGGVVANCAGESCSVFATGRSDIPELNPVFVFDFVPDEELITGPLFTRNVFSQQRGIDARGVAVSSDNLSMFVASREPDAIATIDVSRIGQLESDGCVVPEGQEPEGGECPQQQTGDPENPRFVVADLVAMPPGPNVIRSIPREVPGVGASDLLAVTTDDSVVLYDTRTGVLAADVGELGGVPSGIAFRTRGEGVRLYVPSFATGTIAVIDIPDLLSPESARLVARLGRTQEGAF